MLAFQANPTYCTMLLPGLNVTIADVLQKEVTPQDFLDHIDIADWLLRTRERPVGEDGRRHSRTFLEIQKYISPEVADQVEALIDDLGLEFFDKVEEVEVEECEPSQLYVQYRTKTQMPGEVNQLAFVCMFLL